MLGHAGQVHPSRGAGPRELESLIAWSREFARPRLIAIEGAKGFGLPLRRRFLALDEDVVDVPTHLMADGRRSSRSRGKIAGPGPGAPAPRTPPADTAGRWRVHRRSSRRSRACRKKMS